MPTYKHTLHGLSLAPFAILAALGLTACPSDDDDDPTNATTVATLSTTAPAESTGPSDSSGDADSTVTASTTTPAESSGDEAPAESSSSGGSECLETDECQEDTDCPGGMCISCICVGGDDTGATMSDYGACDACAPGEQPTGIMGLDGFCFCAPACDGAMAPCPTPTDGDAQAVCALGMDPMSPELCAVVCMPDVTMCPSGGTCEELETPQGTVGLCTHPVP